MIQRFLSAQMKYLNRQLCNIGNDNIYFVMDNIFDDDGIGIGDFMIREVSFDTTTNNLTFNYSFTVAAANNDSGNELDVSGSVNVFVLEQID